MSNLTHERTSVEVNLIRELSALLKQRSEVDKKFSLLQKKFLKKVASSSDLPKEVKKRKAYPKRMKNEHKLIDAIPLVLKDGKKMRTQEICDALNETNIYNSRGEGFYAMVNTRLNQLSKSSESPIKKVGTGIYQIPTKKSSPKRTKGTKRTKRKASKT